MALTERTFVDQIEIVQQWNIQVRMATIIERDGEFVSRTFHRWLLNPDSDISNQEQKVQDIANAAWTPEVRQAYETFKTEQANKMLAAQLTKEEQIALMQEQLAALQGASA